ncbi:chromosome partitioning ATPase [Oceanococcus atlanticus]|uniref:Iron-sulfur cluster carrier protein n=1 Tax=Oceanococcus atlanticus TaxID=1317117 RepID=A0A1Y1SAM2_9GAMM|nr:iron-sulfur cluster carrier protein ApbC [Oceanococcus atlanticus]ORE85034.1 chromosome partitioning ATPase [Oceanococcus atlanticus]
MLDRGAIEQALRAFSDAVMESDLLEYVRDIAFDAQTLSLNICLPFPARRYAQSLRAALAEHLAGLLGGRQLQLQIDWKVEPQAVQGSLKPLPGIRNIIAVASGKGGVGKSTVSANLAIALAAEGASVGMLDADIYGPSQPRMLGVAEAKPEVLEQKMMLPVAAHGVALMSIGLLVDEEQPTIWRGPMVTQALHQLLSETRWPELDYLIIDMPPGTGDTQLSLAQRIPVSGAVIVTTPQDIALLDARKGLKMFEKVGVSVLGIVENMSTHICSNCGHEDPIFGSGGGQAMATQYNVPLLGQLPLSAGVRLQADSGRPTVAAEPDGPLAAGYFQVARRTALALSRGGAAEFPDIVVE